MPPRKLFALIDAHAFYNNEDSGGDKRPKGAKGKAAKRYKQRPTKGYIEQIL